jgi:NADH-quinone oxidoreductase subunit J
MSVLFYFLAALTLGGGIAAMSLRNPVHCALSLVVTFVGLAGIYLQLGAQFLGLAQVLIYVGAVAILLVFVLLLTLSSGSLADTMGTVSWAAGVGVGLSMAVVLVAVVLSPPRLPLRSSAAEIPSVQDVGHALMADFVLPLQVVGVLLTAALIGAAILALQERRPGRASRLHPPR